jgi:hypothetical protein
VKLKQVPSLQIEEHVLPLRQYDTEDSLESNVRPDHRPDVKRLLDDGLAFLEHALLLELPSSFFLFLSA